MAKLTLTDIAAGYALITTFNANNALIEAALENTLSRDGTTPNTMSAALDLNSQLINNLAEPVNDQDAATKTYVDTLTAAITAASGTFNIAEAHNFTGQVDFLNAGGIRIMDAAGTDYAQLSSDSTDFNFAVTNATDVNFTGAGTQYTYDNTIRFIGANNKGIISENVDGTSTFAFASTGTLSSISSGGATPLPILIDGNGEYLRLDVNGVFIEEGSAANADLAGRGQIWIKDDAPNILMYTGDTGVDQQIGRSIGSWTPTFTGFSADPSTPTVNYSRSGDQVTLYFNFSVGTSNATGFSITDLPVAIRPSSTQHVSISGMHDNGANLTGASSCLVNTSGTLTFLPTSDPSGTWTASANKGMNTGRSLTYSMGTLA